MSRYSFCGFALITFVASVNTEIRAQGKQRVVTISEVTIVGRVQKPIAAVDVSRIQPRLTLGNKKQPFVDKIEKAIQEPPF
jgi:hypothetical protein